MTTFICFVVIVVLSLVLTKNVAHAEDFSHHLQAIQKCLFAKNVQRKFQYPNVCRKNTKSAKPAEDCSFPRRKIPTDVSARSVTKKNRNQTKETQNP